MLYQGMLYPCQEDFAGLIDSHMCFSCKFLLVRPAFKKIRVAKNEVDLRQL